MTQDRSPFAAEDETPPQSMVDRLAARALRHAEDIAMRHGFYITEPADGLRQMQALMRALLDELYANPTPGMIEAAAEPIQAAYPEAGNHQETAQAAVARAMRAALDGR